MEGNQDPFCVLRLLESSHGDESRIEVTDVRFEPVRGCGDAWINEVREGVTAGFLEAQEDVVMDGAETEDVRLDDSFQVPPAQQEVLRRGIQEELAVAVENAFLRVARMMAEPLELQSGLEVTQQVNVATFHENTVGFQDLRETREAVDGGSREDDAASQDVLQEVIEDLRGLLAGAEPAREESRLCVPHEVLAVLPALDGECLAIKQENAARRPAVHEERSCKVMVQILQDGHMAPGTGRSHPSVRAAVEHVTIVKGRGVFPASQLNPKRAPTGIAFPPSPAEPDRVSRAAKCALFFMDELREG